MASRDFLLRIVQDWSQPTRAARAYAQAVKREMAEVQQQARTSGTAPDLLGRQAAAEAEIVTARQAGLSAKEAAQIRRGMRQQFDAARQEIARAIGAEVARPSKAQLRAAVAYDGEKPYVCHWVKHPLTDEQLTGVDVSIVITIWDLDDTVLVDDAPMVYDATLTSKPVDDSEPQVGGWYYVWESPAGDPGSYLSRITVVEHQAKEYKTIRLRTDKAPVVV